MAQASDLRNYNGVIVRKLVAPDGYNVILLDDTGVYFHINSDQAFSVYELDGVQYVAVPASATLVARSNKGTMAESWANATLTPEGTENDVAMYYFGGMTFHWTDTDLTDAAGSVVYAATDAAAVYAQAPDVTLDLTGQSYTFEMFYPSWTTLTVEGQSPDGGTISYQWMRREAGSSYVGNISGGTKASCTPETNQYGTWEYFCRIKNALNSQTGTTIDTRAVTVTVTPTGKIVELLTAMSLRMAAGG